MAMLEMIDYQLTAEQLHQNDVDAEIADSLPWDTNSNKSLTFAYHAMSLGRFPTIQAAASLQSKILHCYVSIHAEITEDGVKAARDIVSFNWRGIVLMIEEDTWAQWLPTFCSNRIKVSQTEEVIIITQSIRSAKKWQRACTGMQSRAPIHMHWGSMKLSALFVTGMPARQREDSASLMLNSISKATACKAAGKAMGTAQLEDRKIVLGVEQ
jgi:hypothetical protein